jgi:septal ring factor EnvC (AmiA/AmiB activator)
MNEQLEKNLKQLKNLESEISALEELKNKIRGEVFEVLEKEQMSQYKSDIATVSYVEKRTVKYDKDKALEKVKDLPKYYEVVPEHRELNKEFEKDLRDGKIEIDGAEIEVKKMPMIRFAK